MNQSNDPNTIVTFTGRGPDVILEEGGSQAWVLDQRRARKAQYLVCTQNQHGGDWGNASEDHGSAFLVGKISAIVPSDEPGNDNRYMIQISEYARVDIPNAWQGWRNPVRYTSLSEMGIDPDDLDFKPVPEAETSSVPSIKTSPEDVRPLTITDAKQGLALNYGVSPDAVEITIRG